MGMQKAIASAITGLVAVAAAFGLTVPPEIITIVQSVVGTGLVWWVSNKG